MSDLLQQMLERNARKFPHDLAVICHVTETNWTWSELNQKANQLAYFLQEKGVSPKDHIAILFSNQIEYVISFFAILKTGATVIPINVKLTGNEIERILKLNDAKGLIFHPNFSKLTEELSLKKKWPVSIQHLDFLQHYSEENLEIKQYTEDISEILLTSGTTGNPKGVMLSHRAVYQSAMMMAYEMGIYTQDRVLHLMPLTHSAPLNLMLMGAVFAGATSVLDNFTSSDKLLEFTEKDRITHFFGAPIAYLLALKVLQNKEYNLTSMKKWIYGGAPMPSNYLDILRKKFPGEFVGVYGLTEAGPNGLALFDDEHEKHIGTIGRKATVNTEFKVVDEKGNELPWEVAGEIILRTNSLMSGYYKNPEATSEIIKGDWLYTGDIGRVDNEGYLHIIDRKKDVIISGGVNIYPSEVEEALYHLDGIADAAVISKPHEEWGETVAAIVVKKDGIDISEEDIKEQLQDRLAKFKIPREIIFVTGLPRNASGKILKHLLRDQYR